MPTSDKKCPSMFIGKGYTTACLDENGLPKYERWGFFWKIPLEDFHLDPVDPLTFWDEDCVAYQPDRNVSGTDGGSIPPPLWVIPGLSSKGLPRAYYFHDSAFRYGGLYVKRPGEERFVFRRLTRRQCNILLGRMVRPDGGGRAQECMILTGLAIGSWFAWDEEKQEANRKTAGISVDVSACPQ